MKKLYPGILLVLLMLVCSYTALSQVSVTATAGTTGPTSYTTLKAAFDAINAGTHQGAITVSITGSTTETLTAELEAPTTPANYTSVLVVPTVTATIGGSLNAPLINLDRAQNVTFDGRIGSTGTTRSLTIQNTSTSADVTTSTIRFINGVSNVSLKYLNIQGSSLFTNGETATILIDSTTSAAGNTTISITNNDISAAGSNTPSVAIYSIGESATLVNSAVTISSNLIRDYFAASGLSGGIIADAFSTGWTISDNHFYQTAVRTSTANTTHIPVYLFDGNGYTVNNNFIGGSASNAGGTAYTINGGFNNYMGAMYFRMGTTTATNVDGNTITNINITSTSTANAFLFTGIRVVSGTVNIGMTTANTIGAATGTGAISLNPVGANANFSSAIVTGTSSGPGAVDIRNNIIGSISVNGTGTGAVNLRIIETSGHTAVNVQGNTIGGTTANSIQTNTPSATIIPVLFFETITGVANTVTGNTIRNITNNGTGTGNANITAIHLQLNTASINVTNTVTNNIIHGLSSPATTATAGSVFGISMVTGGTATGATSDGNFNNNQIYNLSSGSTATGTAVRAISNASGYAGFLNINGNTIHTLTAAAPNTIGNVTLSSAAVVQGIVSSTSGAGTLHIGNNTINNLEATANAATHVMGVGVFYGNANATIEKNTIHNLRSPNAAAGIVSGLVLRGVSAAGTFNIINNMISLSPSGPQVYGIHNNSAATLVNTYFNSVYIGGSATAANNSAGFFRNAVATGIDLKNNILYNVRTGGTGGHYALVNTNATPATGWVSNYNNLYAATAANTALWGAAAMDLNTYKTNAGDANSKAVTVNFVNAAAGDLHLTGASTTDANLDGTAITGITTDIDNDTRNTPPKMGADEPVTTCVAPAITTQPTAQTGCVGGSVTFTVVATGTGLNYQWKKGGTDITGATNASYTINSLVTGDAGDYTVVITNGCGTVTSSIAALTVNTAPTITTQPTAQTVCSGSNANFSVVASGTGLSYQWKKDGTDISGATSSTLTITGATAANAGSYSVVVSNGNCSVTSTSVSLTVNAAPAITTQPTITNPVCFNSNASLTVVASGTGLSYQWKKDGTDIPGATSATYNITNAAASHSGNYTVVVTNTCGNVTSNAVTLTVGACTSIPNIDADITRMVLMPNLVQENTVLRIQATRSMKINFNVMDAAGRVVMSFSSQVYAGQNDIQVQASRLSSGVYSVLGTTEKGNTELLKFIKQ